MEPTVVPQMLEASDCPARSAEAKAKLTAHIYKTHKLRVSVVTKCIAVNMKSAQLIRKSFNVLDLNEDEAE